VERFAQIAREVFPVQLHCTPSYAEYLIKNLPERAGIEARELMIKRVVVAGEPGGSVPHIRQRIEEGFGAKVYDMIGSTGAVFLSSMSCDANAGMHFIADDFCLFEVIDPKSLEPLPFEDGVEGEVVTTGLEKECAPLPRWRDKDIVQVFTEPCECGKPGFRFIVKARADDMLLIRGVNVFPHAIRDVVMTFSPKITGNIRIVLENPPPVVQPPLPVRVEYSPELTHEQADLLANEMEDKIHHLLRFRAKIEMVLPGFIPIKTSATGKTNILEKRYKKDA
jgi:phenylacetate-CoA ligase